MRLVQRPRAAASSAAPPDEAQTQLTYNIVPEWGGGADLRAIPSDISNAVTVTDHAKQTDRGIRGVTSAQALDGKDVRLHDQTGSLTASMGARSANKRVGTVAYEVDKERGIPNPEGIRVSETVTSPTITATGDPTERTDRGLRVLSSGTTAVRRLTPTECERLQGFPDGWSIVEAPPKKTRKK